MAIQITRRDVEDAFAHLRDQSAKLSRYSAKGESVVGSVVQTTEIAAGALANGVLSGRYGNMYLGNTKVPLDLLVALGAHGLAFFGVADKHGEHLHNFADGFLAGYLTKVGAGLGAKLAQKQGATPHVFSGTGTRHGYGYAQQLSAAAGAGAPLTEAELVSMAQAIR